MTLSYSKFSKNVLWEVLSGSDSVKLIDSKICRDNF